LLFKSTKSLDLMTQQIVSGTLANLTSGFLTDFASRQLSKHTLRYYTVELGLFKQWLNTQGVIQLTELTPGTIRLYLLDLSARRNPGGQHAAYRAIRTLLRWTWDELELETRNPIARVWPPKVVNNPLPGVDLATIRALIASTASGQNAARDKALFLFLADSGLRASELCALDVEDVDLLSGTVIVRSGKGGKRRVTDIGKLTRRELRRYLRTRPQSSARRVPLFATDENTRLTYSGLRQIVRWRALAAHIPEPGLHGFRHFAALAWLRAGRSLVSVSRRLGHAGLEITRRYLALIDEDFRDEAERKGAPSDFL
jgi:site-specific recombinase XerD